MSILDKYQEVVALSESFDMMDTMVEEQENRLKIKGMVRTQYEKNQIWDMIKEISGGMVPEDLEADITVENPQIFHFHTVEKGETLSKISNHYYKDAKQYMTIFEANQDVLKDPNKISIGQELTIPVIE